MNVIIDRDMLEEARKIVDKKTYSETINHALAEIVRVQKVREAFDYFSTDWWDGDLETLMQMRTDPDIPESPRVAANTVRAPRARKKRGRTRR